MGVVLNPIAFRVGYKYSWRDAWYSHRLTYSVFLHDVLHLKMVLHFVFFRYFSYKWNVWLYSHVTIYIYNNKIFVNMFFYDGNDVQLFYDVARRYKKIYWFRMNTRSGWFQKNLFDKKSRLKRFHFLTRALRFFYDFFTFEDVKLLFRRDRRTLYNLKRLKKEKSRISRDSEVFYTEYNRYFKKKKKILILLNHRHKKTWKYGWLPWEEIKYYRLPFENMVFDINQLGLKWWLNRYNLMYTTALKKIIVREKLHIKKRIKNLVFKPIGKMTEKRYFKKFPKRMLLRNILKREFKPDTIDDVAKYNEDRKFTKKYFAKYNFKSRVIRYRNKLLFFFLIFFNKLFNRLTWDYDEQIFTRRWIRKFLRNYVFFMVKKHIIKRFGKFVEYLACIIGLNVNVKLYILNNNSVGAEFISRFIALGLRNRYDYLDMIIPIKKNLRKQMYVKKWISFEKKIYKPDFEEQKNILVSDFYLVGDIINNRRNIVSNYITYSFKEHPKKASFWKFEFLNKDLKKYIKKNKSKKNNNNSNNNKNNKNNNNNKNKIILFLKKLYFFYREKKSKYIYLVQNLFTIRREYNYKRHMRKIWIKLYLNMFKYKFYTLFPMFLWLKILKIKVFDKYFNKKMFIYYCFLIKKKLLSKLNRYKWYNNIKYYSLLLKTYLKIRIIRKAKKNPIVIKGLKYFKNFKNIIWQIIFNIYLYLNLKRFILRLKWKFNKKLRPKPSYKHVIKVNGKYKLKKNSYYGLLWEKRILFQQKVKQNKKFIKKVKKVKKNWLKFYKNFFFTKFYFIINGIDFYKDYLGMKMKFKLYLFNTNLYNNFIIRYFYKFSNVKKTIKKLKYKYKKKVVKIRLIYRKLKKFLLGLNTILKNNNVLKNIENINYLLQSNLKIKENNIILLNKNKKIEKKNKKLKDLDFIRVMRKRLINNKKSINKNNNLIESNTLLLVKNLNIINKIKKNILTIQFNTETLNDIKTLLYYKIKESEIKLYNKKKKKFIVSLVNIVCFNISHMLIIFKLFNYFFNKTYIKSINFLKFSVHKKKKKYFNFLTLVKILYKKILLSIKFIIRNIKYDLININSINNFKCSFYKFLKYYKFKKIYNKYKLNKLKNIIFFKYNNINNFFLTNYIKVTDLKKQVWNLNKNSVYDDKVELLELKRVPIFFTNKTKKLKYFDDNSAVLFGYKFHFVGRFTRKQQSANLWFRLGSLENSSATANVDYAIYTVIMKYSVCTVKVWLYKSYKAAKYKFRVF